jgi:hypothetical protein
MRSVTFTSEKEGIIKENKDLSLNKNISTKSALRKSGTIKADVLIEEEDSSMISSRTESINEDLQPPPVALLNNLTINVDEANEVSINDKFDAVYTKIKEFEQSDKKEVYRC